MVFLFSSFSKYTSEEMLDTCMDWALAEKLKQPYSLRGKPEDGRGALRPPMPALLRACASIVLNKNKETCELFLGSGFLYNILPVSTVLSWKPVEWRVHLGKSIQGKTEQLRTWA